MIVKGKSRSGPAQLAAYLLRSDEHAELIELRDGGTDLHKAFMAWHTIGEASRGEKTLYHAQISPHVKYPMTREQALQAAQMLAEGLGMADHPRATVLHQGDGRPHIHVVFQRANPETFKLWDDSFNYVKHERASLRMEKEFGMEIIPGKHAKRDRKKQPEFPRAKLSEDEDQYQKRTRLSKQDRVRQITALHAASDSGPAFKAALEDAGYILAQGDRGYIVVDRKGGQSVLTRNVGMKKKQLEAYMAGVGLDKLPTIEEAKALQAERRKARTVSKSDGQAAADKQPEKKGVEASKFLQPQTTPKQPERAPAPADAELEALKKALADREAKEAKDRAEAHAAELRQCQAEMDALTATKTTDFDRMQQQERNRLKARHAKQRKGLKGFMDAVHDTLKTKKAADKAKQRRQETAQFKAKQERERKQYLELLQKNRQLEIENLKERQTLRDQRQEQKNAEERERYIREYHQAKRLREEVEAERRKEEQERIEKLRDGPPPPKLGK